MCHDIAAGKKRCDYRVLIGLTIEETEELFRLDAILSAPAYYVDASFDVVETSEETRWMLLLNKHDAAMRPFLNIRSVKH